jgi:Domain of unknown function (DUF4838)
MNRFILALWGCLLCVTGVAADPVWLWSSEYGRLHIVLSDDADPAEHQAATWFQRHWSTTTGNLAEISSVPLPRHINVWIGMTDNPYADAESAPRNDGVVIQTVSRANKTNQRGDPEDRNLILYGGSPRGSLYAVWEFFERYMGMRWLALDAFRVPLPPDSLPTIHYRHEPPFWYRDISYRAYVSTPWKASQGRVNGFWSRLEENYGGRISYVGGFEGSGHTFHDFVPPDAYFEDHPEYFAEIDGVRRVDGQLCLTNPDVLRITIEAARKKLRQRGPYERILSISQMDFFWFDSWCTCVTCAALDAREGNHAGTIIHFVNAVAEALEDEFPDVYIDTFAYQYSRKPPKYVRPRDNVIVRLCDFEADFSRPLADRRSKQNRAFLRDLKKWARITEHVFIWDYTQNWYSHQGPHPNIHVLQPNIKLFAKLGVDGVFEQASWESPHSDYEFLKGTILEHALWDPNVNWKKLYREFLDLYYGDAAPYINKYQQLIRDRTRDVVLTLNNRMTWMDYDTVVAAQAIFEETFRHTNDPVFRERLQYAYLPVQYAALVCPPKVFLTDAAYTLVRPPSQTFDEFWDMIMDYGVTRLEDWPIEAFRERLHGKTPPRYEVQPIQKLKNRHLEVWVVPGLGGKIVRARQLQNNQDWLGGYINPLSDSSMVDDRIVLEEDWLTPVDKPYTVVDLSDSSVTLETLLSSGVRITKRISLDTQATAMTVHVTYTNTTHHAVPLRAQIHARWTPGDNGSSFQRWRYDDVAWSRMKSDADQVRTNADTPAWWALRSDGHTLLNRVSGTDKLLLEFRFSRNSRDTAMNVYLSRNSLAPGDAASVTSTTIWSKRPPARFAQ